MTVFLWPTIYLQVCCLISKYLCVCWGGAFQISFCCLFLIEVREIRRHHLCDSNPSKFVYLCFIVDYGLSWWIFHIHLKNIFFCWVDCSIHVNYVKLDNNVQVYYIIFYLLVLIIKREVVKSRTDLFLLSIYHFVLCILRLCY